MKTPAPMVIDPSRPHLGGNLVQQDGSSLWPDLIRWLCDPIQSFFGPLNTVLDVGSGKGESMELFCREGCYCTGIEGLEVNAKASTYPVLVHDLTRGPVQFTGIDLVWCVEVVEHIEEKYLDNLLRTITVGRYLAMTHAVPGQGGHHHVNCQPWEYWMRNVERYGMLLDLELTRESRKHVPAGSFWHRSGLIFKRG